MTAYVYTSGGFPSSPVSGDTLSINSAQYSWDGATWIATAVPSGPQGATGPAGAAGAAGSDGADSTVAGPAGPAGPSRLPGPSGPSDPATKAAKAAKASRMPFRVWSDTETPAKNRVDENRRRFDRQFIDLCSSALIFAMSRSAAINTSGVCAPLMAYFWSMMKKGTPATPICCAASISAMTVSLSASDARSRATTLASMPDFSATSVSTA